MTVTVTAEVTAEVAAPRRGLVLGAGGVLGAAWTIGALTAVQDELGWDPREAEVLIGTSAGSVLALLPNSAVLVVPRTTMPARR